MFSRGDRVETKHNSGLPGGKVVTAARNDFDYNEVRHDDGKTRRWFTQNLVREELLGGFKPGDRVNCLRFDAKGTILTEDAAKLRLFSREVYRPEKYLYVGWDGQPYSASGMLPSSLEPLVEKPKRVEDSEEYQQGYAAALDDAEDKLNVVVDNLASIVEDLSADLENAYSALDDLRRY